MPASGIAYLSKCSQRRVPTARRRQGPQRRSPRRVNLTALPVQVGQDLAQPDPADPLRHQIGTPAGSTLTMNSRFFAPKSLPRPSPSCPHPRRIPGIHFDLLDLETPGLDLGEVQDVIDDRHQSLGAAANRVGEIELRRGERVSSRPDMPMTPFIGVRISWLMFARNSLFDLVRRLRGFLRRNQRRLGLALRRDVLNGAREASLRALRVVLVEATRTEPAQLTLSGRQAIDDVVRVRRARVRTAPWPRYACAPAAASARAVPAAEAHRARRRASRSRVAVPGASLGQHVLEEAVRAATNRPLEALLRLHARSLRRLLRGDVLDRSGKCCRLARRRCT